MGVTISGVLGGRFLRRGLVGRGIGCGFNVFVGRVGGCGRVSPRGERQACLSFLQVLVVVSLPLSLLPSVLASSYSTLL